MTHPCSGNTSILFLTGEHVLGRGDLESPEQTLSISIHLAQCVPEAMLNLNRQVLCTPMRENDDKCVHVAVAASTGGRGIKV